MWSHWWWMAADAKILPVVLWICKGAAGLMNKEGRGKGSGLGEGAHTRRPNHGAAGATNVVWAVGNGRPSRME